MTPKQAPARHPGHLGWVESSDSLTGAREIRCYSAERTRAVNEVGSAIVHQLNGPLTALRLYVGEIRQSSGRSREADGAQGSMQQMVESAFQETERVCAIMKLIADSFEEPLYPETAAALGRDVIGWWSRSGNGNERDSEQTVSIHELLTPREREVLSQISQGCSNKQGAARMKIGSRTFESHRFRIMRKLGAKNGADLVRIALGENAVTP
jgi:DNA-binding CsgD family transcriptional regulator